MSFRKRRGLHATLTACAVIVGVLAGTTQSASAFVRCPAALVANRSAHVTIWNTLWGTRRETAKGVTLCQGEGGGFNTRGYLEIADLGDGAKIRLQSDLNPESLEPNTYQTHTSYAKRTAEDWYSWIRGLAHTEQNAERLEPENSRLFSTTNATFFTEAEELSTTYLPFMFGSGAGLETLGLSFQRAHPFYPNEEWHAEAPRPDADYEAPKKALLLGDELWEAGSTAEIQQVRIQSFPSRYEIEDMGWEWWEESFFTEDYAVSFTPEYRVGGRESTLRTYVGLYGRVVYIWITDDEYTNAEASATMQEIKPGMRVIQMDGGGSAQFYSAYGSMRSQIPIFPRKVPNVLAIYRAR
jgi:hypothetical protein